MNLSFLSKEELLVILVGCQSLNKRNFTTIYTDQYIFNHETEFETFSKFLSGVKSLFDKEYVDQTSNDMHERFIYSYTADRESKSIKISFGQCIRNIYSELSKNIDNISTKFLDYNCYATRILLGMLVPSIKRKESDVVIQVPEFIANFSKDHKFNLSRLIKKACSELSYKSIITLQFEIIDDEIKIYIQYKTKAKRNKRNGLRDLYTCDMFNGLTEGDINQYLEVLLTDQRFYLFYSKLEESKEAFSVRLRSLMTCNNFSMIQRDVELLKSRLNF